MKTLILTVGLPRSGKSTWATKHGAPIVNPDSIRLAIHGEAFIAVAEPFVWLVAKTMVASLFLAGHDTVILDATNLQRKRRDEWADPRWTRRYEVFNESVDTCVERAKLSGREYLIPVIHRMNNQREKILSDETDTPDY